MKAWSVAASSVTLATVVLASSGCTPGDSEPSVHAELVVAVEELRALRAEIAALKLRTDSAARASHAPPSPSSGHLSVEPASSAPRAASGPVVTPLEPPTVSVGPALQRDGGSILPSLGRPSS